MLVMAVLDTMSRVLCCKPSASHDHLPAVSYLDCIYTHSCSMP